VIVTRHHLERISDDLSSVRIRYLR